MAKLLFPIRIHIQINESDVIYWSEYSTLTSKSSSREQTLQILHRTYLYKLNKPDHLVIQSNGATFDDSGF